MTSSMPQGRTTSSVFEERRSEWPGSSTICSASRAWADPDGRQTEEAGTVAAVMNFLQVGVEALVADVSGQRREEIAAGERERATIEAVNGFFYGKDCGGGPPGCSRRFNRRVPKPPPPS